MQPCVCCAKMSRRGHGERREASVGPCPQVHLSPFLCALAHAVPFPWLPFPPTHPSGPSLDLVSFGPPFLTAGEESPFSRLCSCQALWQHLFFHMTASSPLEDGEQLKDGGANSGAPPQPSRQAPGTEWVCLPRPPPDGTPGPGHWEGLAPSCNIRIITPISYSSWAWNNFTKYFVFFGININKSCYYRTYLNMFLLWTMQSDGGGVSAFLLSAFTAP